MKLVLKKHIIYFIAIAGFMLFNNPVNAQNNAIFNGGVADGFAAGKYQQAQAGLTGNSIFTGGIADGFAYRKFTQAQAGLTGNSIYLGGIADGFAVKGFSQSHAGLTGNTIYLGGIADGFAFGNFGNFGNEQPLPIELLSFDTHPLNNKSVICQWITATEINNDYFTVEHSRDGKNFEAIGKVTGAGNSTLQLNYLFTDNEPFTGTSYYRLKQTDFDGRFTHSITVTVNLYDHNFSSASVYPNPVKETATISTGPAIENADGVFELYDVQGKKVCSEKLAAMQGDGEHTFIFKRGSLKAGLYFFSIKDISTTVGTGKMVIQ